MGTSATSTARLAAVTYRARMSRQANKRPLTTTEQVLRWTGLGMLVLALLVGLAQIPGMELVPPLLLTTGIGCYIALAVVSFREGRRTG